MLKNTFLVEVGTEELPTSSLKKLGLSFLDSFSRALDESNVLYEDIEWFATSRRLALKVKAISSFQLDREVKRIGPSVNCAFDKDGNPSRAAIAWIKQCNISFKEVSYTEKKNREGEWLAHRQLIKGKKVELILPDIISYCLKKLQFSDSINWYTSTKLFRRVLSITLMLGSKTLENQVLGVQSNNKIQGHMTVGTLKLKKAEDYPSILMEKGNVIANFGVRKKKIQEGILKAVSKLSGKSNIEDKTLEKYSSSTEWPVVMVGKFSEKFLSIPSEILVSAIQSIQDHLPVYTKSGKKLLPYFIFIANVESKSPERVVSGYEKVLSTCLKDIVFFLENDAKKKLEENIVDLKHVLFASNLGNMFEKTCRLKELIKYISQNIDINHYYAKRTALLSKCDLVTDMVIEFPDMRGIVGSYYSKRDNELPAISEALKEYYKPRFSSDELPNTEIGCLLAVADKLDTLVGILGITKYPSSEKDPFALRRDASGIARILIDKNISLNINELIKKSISLYGNKLNNQNVGKDVLQFIINRLYTFYQEKRYKKNIVQAVLNTRNTEFLNNFDMRIKSLNDFSSTNKHLLDNILTIIRRVSKILDKSYVKKSLINLKHFLSSSIEMELLEKIIILNKTLELSKNRDDYFNILVKLSGLQKPVDYFFKTILINAEDRKVRAARLNLLLKLHNLFLCVADFSLLI